MGGVGHDVSANYYRDRLSEWDGGWKYGAWGAWKSGGGGTDGDATGNTENAGGGGGGNGGTRGALAATCGIPISAMAARVERYFQRRLTGLRWVVAEAQARGTIPTVTRKPAVVPRAAAIIFIRDRQSDRYRYSHGQWHQRLYRYID